MNVNHCVFCLKIILTCCYEKAMFCKALWFLNYLCFSSMFLFLIIYYYLFCCFFLIELCFQIYVDISLGFILFE